MYADWRGWSNGRSAELVGVAQPIARCGEVGGIGRRGLVFERGVRPLAVVVGDPGSKLPPGVVETEEQGLVQELVAHPAVEALDERVLDRLARCNEVPVDGVVLAPSQHRVAGELGAVVRDDRTRLAALGDVEVSSRATRRRDGRLFIPVEARGLTAVVRASSNDPARHDAILRLKLGLIHVKILLSIFQN